MRARVTVTLKTGILDPQGKAIEGALASLGVAGIASVRQGKIFDIEVDAPNADATEAVLRQAAEKLLANTVVENFQIAIEQPAAGAQPSPSEDEFAPDTPVPAAADEA
jgi:phosphoribosylformylglycinamidine synthase PurS subunit